MGKHMPVVAIIGRTNVGKSTLFNAIAQRRVAVVEDYPGVTRDRLGLVIRHFNKPFMLVDTGGLVGEDDPNSSDQIQRAVREQAEVAIREADLILCVFDGISGVHPLDHEVVDAMRRSNKKVLWVINKCEKQITSMFAGEFYALGLDEFACVSAAHRQGTRELSKSIAAALWGDHEAAGEISDESGVEELQQENLDQYQEPHVEGSQMVGDRPIKVAVVGRPNVGKSSLINRILGEDRLIASEQAGTTRDAIDIELRREGRDFVIIDTAGLRKRSRVSPESIERYSNLRSLRSLVGSDVIVLVLDATRGAPSDQDQRIAQLAHERGRGLVIAVNKWDAVEKDHRSVKNFREIVRRQMPFVKYAPILFISALSGKRCPAVLTSVAAVYDAARVRVRTSDLNKLLASLFTHRPPPVVRGEPVKLYFATQTAVAPPTIVLFLNHPKELKPSYQRYLKDHIRKHFPFEGVDLRLVLRKRTEKAHARIVQG